MASNRPCSLRREGVRKLAAGTSGFNGLGSTVFDEALLKVLLPLVRMSFNGLRSAVFDEAVDNTLDR